MFRLEIERVIGEDWVVRHQNRHGAGGGPAHGNTIGNTPREIATVRAPGTAMTALSLFKSILATQLREGSLLEFRAEAFNALNQPQFAAPNLTVGSGEFSTARTEACTSDECEDFSVSPVEWHAGLS